MDLRSTEKPSSPRRATTVPVMIHYRVFVDVVVSREKDGEVIFSRWIDPTPVTEGVAIPYEGPRQLDPYKVREAFTSAKTEQQIRSFLSAAGDFWPFGHISMTEFTEWQELIHLIRREDFIQLAAGDERARDAYLTIHNFTVPNSAPRSFFTATDQQAQEEEARILGNMQAGPREEMKRAFDESRKWSRQRRRELFQYITQPQASVVLVPTPEIECLIEKGEHKPVWPMPYSETMPTIVFTPTNVLEAIAATIAADRLQGIRHRACASEDCRNLIPISKGSRERFYCEGKMCKARARLQRRAEADHAARMFYMAQRRTGMDPSVSEQLASNAGHVLSQRLIERAEKALARERASAR